MISRYVKIAVILFAAICASSLVQGQVPGLPVDSIRSGVYLNASSFIESSSITWSFVHRMLFGGPLDANEAKYQSFYNMGGENRFMGQEEADVHAILPLSYLPKNVLLKVGFSKSFQVVAKFPNDAFYLAFFGNHPGPACPFTFSNNEDGGLSTRAELGGTVYRQWQLDKYSVGLAASNGKWDINLHFIHATRYREYQLTSGSLVTNYFPNSEAPRELQFTGRYLQRNSLKPGYGMGLSADFRQPILKSHPGKTFVKVGVSNLGNLWFSKVNQADSSGTINFQGLSVNPSSGFATIGNLNNLTDSLLPSFATSKAHSIIPGNASVQYFHQSKMGYYYSAGLSFFWPLANNPMIFGRVGYRNKTWQAGITESFGGYTRWNTGISLGTLIAQRVEFSASANYFMGWFSNKRTSRSLDIHLNYFF